MIAGEIPTYKVFEDDKVFAILDINPANEGHVLLLPKQHFQILPQVPPELLGHMMIIAKKISQMMLSVMRVKGTSLLFEVGEAAGQKAPHVMLHIIPTNPNNKILQLESVSQGAQQFEQMLKLLRSKTGYSVQEQPAPSQQPVVKAKEVVDNSFNEKTTEELVKEEVKEQPKKEVVEEPKTPVKKDIDLDSISKLFG